MPLCESSRETVIHSVKEFLSAPRPYDVLIVSYETFRIHAALFATGAPVDILVCDEAHRLKNNDTKTNKALDSLTCRRRVLMSGTPMQNHLDEVCIASAVWTTTWTV
jgi:DNA repair and recombination protein RAD54 and RAD54-like protein